MERSNPLLMSDLQRRHDIDWLRGAAVVLLIPFHAGVIFAGGHWYVTASPSDLIHYGVVVPLDAWHMPLLFVLAGASSWFALEKRSKGEFLRERMQRILIPLLSGLLLFVPIEQYFAALHHRSFDGSFPAFLPGYFASIVRTDLAGFDGGFALAHLWFLLVLFAISALLLPLLHRLRLSPPARLIRVLHDRPFLLLLAPLLTVWFLLPPLWITGRAIFYYGLMFVFGALLASSPALQASIHSQRRRALVLGLVCLILPLVGYATGLVAPDNILLDFMIYVCASWYIQTAIIAYARQYLSSSSRFTRYWNKAGLPVYVLHQPVLVAIAYYVLPLDAPAILSFLLLTGTTLVVSLALYEGVIRRFPIAQRLFGLRPMAARVETTNHTS